MIAKLKGGGTLVGGRATIIGPGAPNVIAEGLPVSCMGDAVTPHGEAAHAKATIATSSKSVFAMGRGVVRMGDVATCGDPVKSVSTVFVGP
jgi:uncharacterized Zn-binding protein involved in type VI secretion